MHESLPGRLRSQFLLPPLSGRWNLVPHVASRVPASSHTGDDRNCPERGLPDGGGEAHQAFGRSLTPQWGRQRAAPGASSRMTIQVNETRAPWAAPNHPPLDPPLVAEAVRLTSEGSPRGQCPPVRQ